MTRFTRNLGSTVGLLLGTLLATAPVAVSVEKSAAPAPEERGSEPAGISLAQLAVCEDVVDRAPVGPSETFPKGVARLSCFTDIRGATPPTQIFHRWYIGDQLVTEVAITVKGSRWRCWSHKTILPKWEGPGRVDILTEEGDVLGSAEFVLE